MDVVDGLAAPLRQAATATAATTEQLLLLLLRCLCHRHLWLFNAATVSGKWQVASGKCIWHWAEGAGTFLLH